MSLFVRLSIWSGIIALAACQQPIIHDAPPVPEYAPSTAFGAAYKNPACEPLRIVIKDCETLRDQVRTAR